MHRICGWLSQEMGDRAAPGSRFGIWNGRGGADALEAVLNGTVDISIATPTAAAHLLRSRLDPSSGDPKRLLSLGTLPQRDRLVVCVDSALGVSSITDLAEVASELRIATSPDDGVNTIGLAAHELLRRSGVEPETVVAAGGTFSYHERPFTAVAQFAVGHANVLIHEAIMMPAWQRVAGSKKVRYLPIGAEAIGHFAAHRWGTAVVPAGYLPGLDEDLETLDFSDFMLLCRDDLADDVASLAAWCMIATRDALEAQYRHMPAERSPLTYPLNPAAVAASPLEIHAAAAAVYRDIGDTTASEALIWS